MATFSGGLAQAQSIASIGGPRETPPASYSGQQYVDSRGCVFLRAGYGGQINWVPRVTSDRKVLCGFPPTFAKVTIEIAEEAAPVAVQPAAPIRTVPAQAAPLRTVEVDPATYTPAPYTPPGRRAAPVTATLPAPLPRRSAPAALRVPAPAPYTAAAPRTVEAVPAGPGPGKIGCFASAPVAEVVRLRSGGTAVVCTRGDGGLAGWRPPIYPAGSAPGAALRDPVVVKSVAKPTRMAANDPVQVATVAPTLPAPPAGYKLAWKDDRLNPLRAQGTAAGQAAQDQVWTRKVPAEAVAGQPRRTARVTVSTKSEPQPPVARSGALVQVGTFGVASNADGAAARLAGLGLPVTKGRTTKGGKALQIVYAGPFASGAETQAALSAARRAGFPDAFLR